MVAGLGIPPPALAAHRLGCRRERDLPPCRRMLHCALSRRRSTGFPRRPMPTAQGPSRDNQREGSIRGDSKMATPLENPIGSCLAPISCEAGIRIRCSPQIGVPAGWSRARRAIAATLTSTTSRGTGWTPLAGVSSKRKASTRVMEALPIARLSLRRIDPADGRQPVLNRCSPRSAGRPLGD